MSEIGVRAQNERVAGHNDGGHAVAGSGVGESNTSAIGKASVRQKKVIGLTFKKGLPLTTIWGRVYLVALVREDSFDSRSNVSVILNQQYSWHDGAFHVGLRFNLREQNRAGVSEVPYFVLLGSPARLRRGHPERV